VFAPGFRRETGLSHAFVLDGKTFRHGRSSITHKEPQPCAGHEDGRSPEVYSRNPPRGTPHMVTSDWVKALTGSSIFAEDSHLVYGTRLVYPA